MKNIVTLYQGGQQVNLVQCLRCKEVFTVVLPEHELSSYSAVMALGEQHKEKCPEGVSNSYGAQVDLARSQE